jgi:hypothetical protein
LFACTCASTAPPPASLWLLPSAVVPLRLKKKPSEGKKKTSSGVECGPTALPRHGPIDAFLPRSGGFPALQPRRHLFGAERKTGFKKHLHGWIMW